MRRWKPCCRRGTTSANTSCRKFDSVSGRPGRKREATAPFRNSGGPVPRTPRLKQVGDRSRRSCLRRARAMLREAAVHPAAVPALVLDPADRDGAGLAGAGYTGAAAGLETDMTRRPATRGRRTGPAPVGGLKERVRARSGQVAGSTCEIHSAPGGRSAAVRVLSAARVAAVPGAVSGRSKPGLPLASPIRPPVHR